MSHLKAVISSHIILLSSYCPGHVATQVPSYDILGIKKLLRRAPKVVSVFWHPPLILWVKINTDGLTKGNPGEAACGVVFRGFNGAFKGCFAMPLGFHSSFYAEIFGIIMAIEEAANRGW